VEWELTGEPKYSEKTFPIATFSTTNPDLPLNPDRCGEKPATNSLSNGTALTKQVTRVETGKILTSEKWKDFIWPYKNNAIISSNDKMVLVYEAHLTAHINKQMKKLLSENVWSSSDTVNIIIKGYGRNHKKSRISLALLRSGGHAIAQAFIRCFLTAEVCVQYQGSPCGFFGRQWQ
jgi:hypothetical protein